MSDIVEPAIGYSKELIITGLINVIKKLTDDPEILSIIGSYNDTMNDGEILDFIEGHLDGLPAILPTQEDWNNL